MVSRKNNWIQKRKKWIPVMVLGIPIDKKLLSTIKIWNLTNEIHLTLTDWKPIPYIFPIRTTVPIDRGQEDRILVN